MKEMVRFAPFATGLLLLGVAAPAALPARSRVVLPRAAVHRPYDVQLPMLPGASQCIGYDRIPYEVIDGRLPEGIAITNFGKLSGVPERIGNERFLVRMRNQCTERLVEFSLDVTEAPILSVTPAKVTLRASAGRVVRERFRVSSNWPDLPYSLAEPSESWVKPARLGGVTPAADAAFKADSIEIEFDPAKLSLGEHTAFIKVYAPNAANSPELKITLAITDEPLPEDTK